MQNQAPEPLHPLSVGLPNVDDAARSLSHERQKTRLCEDVEQRLLETIADFLDEEDIQRWQILHDFQDPEPVEKTELHIRMAKAAMSEYRKTMERI